MAVIARDCCDRPSMERMYRFGYLRAVAEGLIPWTPPSREAIAAHNYFIRRCSAVGRCWLNVSKPRLKAPMVSTQHNHKLRQTFAFYFNLRRCSAACAAWSLVHNYMLADFRDSQVFGNCRWILVHGWISYEPNCDWLGGGGGGEQIGDDALTFGDPRMFRSDYEGLRKTMYG